MTVLMIRYHEGESEDLRELERVLEQMLLMIGPGGKRRVELALDLDQDGVRMLYEALLVARLHGQRVQ
jgi:hypothetical protein